MNIQHKYSTLILIYIALIFSCQVNAQEVPGKFYQGVEFSASLGIASIDQENFDSSTASEFKIRLIPNFHSLAVDIGIANFSSFNHATADDTNITINGYFAGISQSYEIGKRFEINVGVYNYRYESKAVLQGFDKGIRKDDAASLHINATFKINKMSAFGGLRFYRDVSGANITVPIVGINVKI